MAKRVVPGTDAVLLQEDGELEVQSLDASSGVYTDAGKALTSTPPTTGDLGYWSRAGTDLSPATAGDDVHLPDNDKVQLGTGKDMDLYYDGADGHLRTDVVAPSDFKVDCGAQKTVEIQTTVWDDFVVPVTAIRLGGANPADEVGYKSGMVISFDDAVDEHAYFVIQLPHRYKEGTDVLFHIHWTIKVSGVGGGAENVKWDFTYSASSPVTPAESWPAASNATLTVDVQNDAADDHLIDTIATMTGTNFKISEVIICSLKRDTTVANGYGDEAYVVSMDVHYEVNTMGSRQELVK